MKTTLEVQKAENAVAEAERIVEARKGALALSLNEYRRTVDQWDARLAAERDEIRSAEERLSLARKAAGITVWR